MNYNNLRGLLSNEDRSAFESEKIRLLAIGSREGVIETIHTLHSLGYAEAGLWSPLLPAPAEGEVMSILTRQRLAQGATPKEP
jgi:hypothetical protein